MSMKDELDPDGPNPPKSEAGKAFFDARDYSLREDSDIVRESREITKLRQAEEESRKRSPHYDQGELPTWDAITGLGLDFLEGNVVKYVSRHRHKGSGEEDLKKALDYVVKLIRWEYKTIGRQELVDIVKRHFEE